MVGSSIGFVNGDPSTGTWELPSALAPACTDSCEHLETTQNGICEDGGSGSSRSLYCDLGTDTADCGCRNGTTVGDWLVPARPPTASAE